MFFSVGRCDSSTSEMLQVLILTVDVALKSHDKRFNKSMCELVQRLNDKKKDE